MRSVNFMAICLLDFDILGVYFGWKSWPDGGASGKVTKMFSEGCKYYGNDAISFNDKMLRTTVFKK